MLLIRSLLNYAWMLVTLIPWGITLMLLSIGLRRTPLWWFAVSWFRVVIWGVRVILGIEVRVSGLEHVPKNATHAAILLAKHQSLLETLLLPTLVPHPLAFVFKRELLRIPFFLFDGGDCVDDYIFIIEKKNKCLIVVVVVEF